MKKIKVMMVSAVILLAIGGAFASKHRAAFNVYTKLEDMYPHQTAECQLRGTCTGTGSLCRVVVNSIPYQLYHTGCVTPANGIFVP